MSEWNDARLVEAYSQKAANPEVNWFEYEVNLPDLLGLMPAGTEKVLDFGSGPGDITNRLSKIYPFVDGCDASPAMIEKARIGFPGVNFFEWSGGLPLTSKKAAYDVVFSKLALNFVEDLDNLAKRLKSVLKADGSLVYSVPHPLTTIKKINGAEYETIIPYLTEIGRYGIQVVVLHRSFEGYFKPFLANGFDITALSEPMITAAQAEKYAVPTEELVLPKRLNLRLTKRTKQPK